MSANANANENANENKSPEGAAGDACHCFHCGRRREAALIERIRRLEAAVDAGYKDRELLRNVHAVVVAHRDRMIESNRELRSEVAGLRSRLVRVREAVEG